MNLRAAHFAHFLGFNLENLFFRVDTSRFAREKPGHHLALQWTWRAPSVHRVSPRDGRGGRIAPARTASWSGRASSRWQPRSSVPELTPRLKEGDILRFHVWRKDSRTGDAAAQRYLELGGRDCKATMDGLKAGPKSRFHSGTQYATLRATRHAELHRHLSPLSGEGEDG
jgi:hypothetical protein